LNTRDAENCLDAVNENEGLTDGVGVRAGVSAGHGSVLIRTIVNSGKFPF
jgi:hypothetical protein